jgi:hypothetical protein
MTDLRKRDRRFRWQLAIICLCWTVVSLANFGIENARWYADATGVLALGSAACMAFLAWRPTNEFAYRWGGALVVGALTLRVVTIIATEIYNDTTLDDLWLAIVQMALIGLLGVLYADWWLTDLKDWHLAHRVLEEEDRASR